MGVPFLVECE